MENPRGTVIALSSDAPARRARVEVLPGPRCARCAAGRGCGAGLPGDGGRPRYVEARIASGVEVHEGDHVRLALEPESLLRASKLVYGLPLGGALLAAAAAHVAGLADPAAVLAALLGVAGGFGIARRRLQLAGCLQEFTPTIVHCDTVPR